MTKVIIPEPTIDDLAEILMEGEEPKDDDMEIQEEIFDDIIKLLGRKEAKP